MYEILHDIVLEIKSQLLKDIPLPAYTNEHRHILHLHVKSWYYTHQRIVNTTANSHSYHLRNSKRDSFGRNYTLQV